MCVSVHMPVAQYLRPFATPPLPSVPPPPPPHPPPPPPQKG